MPDQFTIDELVSRCREGDTDAFRGVVEQLLPVLRSYAAARSLPGIDMDDIVQRSFVEAYKSLDTYELGTNFRAWLLTIAKYQLLMDTTRLRRMAGYQARYVPFALSREVERRLAEAPETDDRLEHLRDCLTDVPDGARDVLRLRYEQGLPINEIADLLHRSAGAVRKQLCLLRQKLHDCVTRKLTGELGHE